jgi:hypothetical protein
MLFVGVDLMDIQRNEAQKFRITHGSQGEFTAVRKHSVREAAFLLDDRVDFFLKRAAADELVDEHVLLLTDAECAVGRLVFDSGIPPAVEMNDVGSGS